MTNSRVSSQSNLLSRRDFLGAASAAIAFAPSSAPAPVAAPSAYNGKVLFFSKALHTMDWKHLAQASRKMGFDGVDLTVRKGGHVAPERAAEDLPKAVAIIREAGLEVPMITTALTSATDPTARPILATAGKLSIQYFKAGYYYYEYNDVRAELQRAGKQLRDLAALAQECGIQAGYHNHSEYIGGPVWDFAPFIESLDPRWAGHYFDPCHATAEGGAGGWKSALLFAAPRLKMAAVKDFTWKKAAKGWQVAICPLGEGMVDVKEFSRILAGANFQGPISLHIEYEPEEMPAAEREPRTISDTERDLAVLKKYIREAYESSGK
ncbi:MAG: sugar phosphate isomerase/epimerase family protein [Terriglobales bacterium]